MKQLLIVVSLFISFNIFRFDLFGSTISLNSDISEGGTEVHQFETTSGGAFFISGGEDRDIFQIGRSDGKWPSAELPLIETSTTKSHNSDRNTN